MADQLVWTDLSPEQRRAGDRLFTAILRINRAIEERRRLRDKTEVKQLRH